MERVVLDTSVLIAIERGNGALPDFARDDDDLAMAAVSVAELLVGVRRADAERRPFRERKVEALIATISPLPYGEAEARTHAELIAHAMSEGRPRGIHDLIIAATAAAHGRTVVTLDRRGFDGLPGVRVRAT